MLFLRFPWRSTGFIHYSIFFTKKSTCTVGFQDLATATLKVFRETLIEQAEQGVDYWPGFQEHWSITCSS